MLSNLKIKIDDFINERLTREQIELIKRTVSNPLFLAGVIVFAVIPMLLYMVYYFATGVGI